MSRIGKRLARAKSEGRPALIPYLTCGFPTITETRALLDALVDGGADIVEMGMPFSDPLADGTTVQRANGVALANRVTLEHCLGEAAGFKNRWPDVPLVLMGYFNPIVARSEGKFLDRAQEAGVDGLIVVDLPPEESEDFRAGCAERGIDLILLVAPTTPDDRLARIAPLASGFVYCVSLAGVTGSRSSLPAHLPAFLERVRRHVSLPLAVGFGLASREHFREVGQLADAVVVGSRLIEVVEGAPAGAREKAVSDYLRDFAGRGTAVTPVSPAG